MIGYNKPLNEQIALIERIIKKNEPLHEFIMHCDTLGLENYYIGAGCIVQTIWNDQTNKDLLYGISDIDFVYYENNDLSIEAEAKIMEQVQLLAKNTGLPVDVKNQARVHLWYSEHFGYEIKPYACIEEAINTWPTTATSIGVRYQKGEFCVYAPFGLNDAFGQVIRANKAQITEEIYKAKADKWKNKWDSLTILPW